MGRACHAVQCGEVNYVLSAICVFSVPRSHWVGPFASGADCLPSSSIRALPPGGVTASR